MEVQEFQNALVLMQESKDAYHEKLTAAVNFVRAKCDTSNDEAIKAEIETLPDDEVYKDEYQKLKAEQSNFVIAQEVFWPNREKLDSYVYTLGKALNRSMDTYKAYARACVQNAKDADTLFQPIQKNLSNQLGEAQLVQASYNFFWWTMMGHTKDLQMDIFLWHKRV